ncbi:DUF1707 domain-containing protein [Actinokineospora sp. UTMC 2448]|uniref:DUF1707 SHOCT-like domain-containing protein n=1 Tax=Actinokineospora sp. UTMC 2448 TaxID=2268449 RepID=UPI002164495B|nr:DUF1707 domain-containing protein [Actinokineospora sp. UTMC 2448]UVS81601.1 hypothetical protein Actkin_05362 [Actinokineospora sp. UTMC 2448]
MGRDADIRVGTTDRERAVAALSDHLAEGRIDIGEYETRCAAATAARTRGDLRAVFADLPAPHPRFDPPAPSPEPVRPAPPPVRRRNTSLVIGGFLVAGIGLIVAVAAVTNSWWALAPALVVAAVLVMVVS